MTLCTNLSIEVVEISMWFFTNVVLILKIFFNNLYLETSLEIVSKTTLEVTYPTPIIGINHLKDVRC